MSLLGACQPIEAGDGGAAAGGEGEGGVQQLSMATGGTGGVYYPLGGGIASVIRENVPGYDATVQETNASVDNMLLIQSGAADMALALGGVVADAVDGVNEFEGNPVDICAIGSLYSNYTQLATTADTGITSVEDLRGRVVSVGAPSSATEVLALRILEAAGIDAETDIERRQLGVAETSAALQDGTIDAGFWSGGLPTGALVELANTADMVLVPTAEYADDLAQQFGDFYFADEIPAGTYVNQEEPVPVVVAPNILVVPTDTPEELERGITAAIFENKEQLVNVHPAAEELDARTAGDLGFIEICPGAQAYYEEQAAGGGGATEATEATEQSSG